nr:MAG TPA: hypothetical protein [Caudoviricetes sp.]
MTSSSPLSVKRKLSTSLKKCGLLPCRMSTATRTL